MCNSPYELTYNDLNPRFLFSCLLERKEEEQNYHCHDFIVRRCWANCRSG